MDFWFAVVSSTSRQIRTRNLLLMDPVSDHPLIHMLREMTSDSKPYKPVVGILEAAIVQALLVGQRFGILTTGTGFKHDLCSEAQKFLGGQSSRFAGLVTSGLGVVELREGNRERVERKMKDASAKVAASGADVILLGCAGKPSEFAANRTCD